MMLAPLLSPSIRKGQAQKEALSISLLLLCWHGKRKRPEQTSACVMHAWFLALLEVPSAIPSYRPRVCTWVLSITTPPPFPPMENLGPVWSERALPQLWAVTHQSLAVPWPRWIIRATAVIDHSSAPRTPGIRTPGFYLMMRGRCLL